MIASETLAFLESDETEEGADHVLWRAPGGRTYILSPPGFDVRYYWEGFKRFDSVTQMRRQLTDSTANRVLLMVLRQDVRRERGEPV